MTSQDVKELFRNTFNTVADGYDNSALRFFPESAARLPGFLCLEGNEHVLDVATGTGAAAMALAAALPDGWVTGIDFSAKMLEQAERKISTRGFKNVDLREMDMQSLAFPDHHFDAATCCFALFFVDDLQEQLCHITSKVKENGKVLVTSFSINSFSPVVDVFFSSLTRYGIEPPTMTWKRVATPQQCTTLFEGAGLKNILVEEIDANYSLKTPEEWWQIVWNGGFRGLVEKLGKEDLMRFRKEHLDEVGALSDAGEIRMELGIIYTVGTP